MYKLELKHSLGLILVGSNVGWIRKRIKLICIWADPNAD